jgi:hypothetical protein
MILPFNQRFHGLPPILASRPKTETAQLPPSGVRDEQHVARVESVAVPVSLNGALLPADSDIFVRIGVAVVQQGELIRDPKGPNPTPPGS